MWVWEESESLVARSTQATPSCHALILFGENPAYIYSAQARMCQNDYFKIILTPYHHASNIRSKSMCMWPHHVCGCGCVCVTLHTCTSTRLWPVQEAKEATIHVPMANCPNSFSVISVVHNENTCHGVAAQNTCIGTIILLHKLEKCLRGNFVRKKICGKKYICPQQRL